MRSLLILLALSALPVALVACGDDDSLGAPCRDARDCDAGVCARGGSFPDGLCTYSCDRDADCPERWACIDKEGGVCMYVCSNSAQCKDAFDNRWKCDNEDRRSAGGRESVCSG